MPPDLARHRRHKPPEAPRRVEVRASTHRPRFPGDAPVALLRCEAGLPLCPAQLLFCEQYARTRARRATEINSLVRRCDRRRLTEAFAGASRTRYSVSCVEQRQSRFARSSAFLPSSRNIGMHRYARKSKRRTSARPTRPYAILGLGGEVSPGRSRELTGPTAFIAI